MKYKGMTINERLSASGLTKAFDQAIRRKNFKEAIEILIKTELTIEQASSIVGTIKEKPNKYGF